MRPATVMEYLDKNDIFTLYWLPQSPDLNIIGNIWFGLF